MALKSGSLVSNIVQKVGTLDQQVIDDSIERLNKKSAHLKGEIYELVKQEYVNFNSCVGTTVALEKRVQGLRDEYQKISTHIEQDLSSRIAKSRDKREEIESKLELTQSRMVLIHHLVEIYQSLEKSRNDFQSGRFVLASERLSSAAESLARIAKQGCDAQVFRALKTEHALVVSDLKLRLQEEWQKFIVWNPKVVPSEPSLDVLSRIELHVKVPSTSQEESMKDIICAMKLLSFMKVWEKRVNLFAHNLLRLIIKPLITHRTLKASQSTSKGDITLRMSKPTDAKETSTPELYEILVTVFRVISAMVVREYKEEWMQKIGKVVFPEIEELVVAHRLSTSIPREPSEIGKYQVIGDKTKEFEDTVVKMGLVEQGKVCKMSEYTNNVHTHFVTQKSQDMLVEARDILMKPIHNTVALSEVNPLVKLAEIFPGAHLSETSEDNRAEDLYGVDIASLSFDFPSCTISQSVQEFVYRLYATMRECANSNNSSTALQLFHLARNMVDLFCAVLSSYHEDAICNLPRVAAIQHNNCMYLAHHLITLGHQFHSQLPPPLNTPATTFIDQVPLVRQLGEECFLAEMRKQSVCISDFLNSFGTFSKVSSDEHREVVHKSLKRALLHISKLSNVYLEVLPTGVHHQAVGGLIEAFVSKIISLVLSMEDITADEANELHAVLNMVVEKSPSSLCLKDGEDSIVTYCKSWEKLIDLAVIMNASLLEIVGLWDYGKGRLAVVFSVSELRGLIKALFKNTERRAVALKKITMT